MSDAPVEEERWEEPAGFAVTPHSSGRIRLHTFPDNYNNDEGNDDSSCCYITIRSVDTSQMSLLDVCNYDNTDQQVDGSGHCVWMGALYFAHALAAGMAMARDSVPVVPSVDDDDDKTGSTISSWYDRVYFESRTVAEMGCGTGTAGIAMWKLLQQQKSTPPKHTYFLDNDAQALDLCRQNCNDNGMDESLYTIHQQGSWLHVVDNPQQHENDDNTCMTFDTILATDVLYDLKIIRPFFQPCQGYCHRNPYIARTITANT